MRTEFIKVHFSLPITFTIFLLFIILTPQIAITKPTSEAQARRVVHNWIVRDKQPLKTPIGTEIKNVITFLDDKAEATYHIVSMEPAGFVIIAGDDTVEPIIGFVPVGEFIPSLDNPLGALVTQDIPSRVKHAREMEKQAATQKGQEYLAHNVTKAAQNKWKLLDRDEAGDDVEFGLATISDIRVAPLLQTFWNQTTESGGNRCYNIFTPNYYPCGCVATAFAQIMRFWQFPTTAVGTSSFTVTVDGASKSQSLLGGNDSGGAYNWGLMDVGPAISDLTHRQAIGRLTHDAGISVNMDYAASGSGADTLEIADALKSTFQYTNAKKGYSSGSNLPTTSRNNMVNPNLDAGYPIAFGITGTSGGHAIVGDGYGYNSGTLYHHLNMGWSGSQNAWYNLPTIDDAYYGFTSVYKCVYNIYTSGSGEIISGRVTNTNGDPISGVTVTATRAAGGSYNAVTNAKGIYALTKVPSSSTYQISAPGFTSREVTTSISADYSTVGNQWGIDFSSAVYTLNVNATGASSVTITGNPATYAGTTNYSKTEIAAGTNIILTAPATAGSSTFSSWSGCDSSSGVTCTLSMTAEKTVTANYATSMIALGQAVDNTNLPWTTGGNHVWTEQTTTYYYGASAAQSGPIGDSQESYIQTIVTGPGTLRFYWKVSSEENWDFLHFFINGTEQSGSISGTVDWTQKTFTIPAGSNTLKWVYTKDESVSENEDQGWLDKVEWNPASPHNKFPWSLFVQAITKHNN
jgi:hypothetical protein